MDPERVGEARVKMTTTQGFLKIFLKGGGVPTNEGSQTKGHILIIVFPLA